ncbi:LytR family transcriptional regulator [Alkalibaculum sp. M08DMB]|uniref:LytR family transcriptional regulator n=1 Tax=Alkalibaculum sporogenes TaxID=2655001 RepID=A0A6A7K8A9_9FIRM|nr:LCP family protein [Alkalibaculum sporogenes]MPW25664.1 LytR family transcriptional regulator [Alkalibaculum sporogenes]
MTKKKSKRGSTKKKVLISIMIIIILLISGFFIAYNLLLGGINTVDMTDDNDELNISADLDKNIVNIALFGIDTRDDNYDGSRADTIMIASIDKIHKKIKLTSIMRDTYVSIPDNKYDKINHSYAFGGPALTVKTINQNFDMNIKNYVTVNFSALEKIVDAVGGVEIDVQANEVSSVKVSSSGLQTLNGSQALDYSRIRKVGNGDYERTERQRTVLESVVMKVLNSKSLPQTLSLIETLSPYIETSFKKTEMITLASTVFTSGIKEMEDTRLPLDDYSKGGLTNGVYYLKPNNLIDNVIYLHDFIYEKEEYVPTSTVHDISNEIMK